jgi:hypothetical protein
MVPNNFLRGKSERSHVSLASVTAQNEDPSEAVANKLLKNVSNNPV